MSKVKLKLNGFYSLDTGAKAFVKQYTEERVICVIFEQGKNYQQVYTMKEFLKLNPRLQ